VPSAAAPAGQQQQGFGAGSAAKAQAFDDQGTCVCCTLLYTLLSLSPCSP
jgi:hypothetical protein